MLKVRNLTIRIGDRNVTSNVSLHVNVGEVVSLFGPVGAGKTSILKTIMGIHTDWSGEVLLNGVSLRHTSPFSIARYGVAFCPEGGGLFASLTVEENLRVASNLNGKRWRNRLDRVIGLFPIIRERWRQRAGTLSGGEKQMIAIARTMLSQPIAVILDEPTTGLAPKGVEAVMLAIGAMAKEQVAVLLVEQKVLSALGVSSRAYVLNSGRIVTTGDVPEIERFIVENVNCML